MLRKLLPGLPDGEAEKVFEPFYRADPSRTRDTGGAYFVRLWKPVE